jgi:hypothetical protein
VPEGPKDNARGAGSIARLLYRVLEPRPEVAPKPGREPERGELADVWQLRKGDKGWRTSRAEPLPNRGRQPITCVREGLLTTPKYPVTCRGWRMGDVQCSSGRDPIVVFRKGSAPSSFCWPLS